MIVDAGGGTVDISSYSFTSTSPLTVEEIASADCAFSPGFLHYTLTHHDYSRYHARFDSGERQGGELLAR